LHSDVGALRGLHSTYVFSTRHKRRYYTYSRRRHTVYISLYGAKLFEVNVDRVRPRRVADIVVDLPLFTVAPQNAVGRMFRVEQASELAVAACCVSEVVRWSSDPELPRRHIL